MTPAASEQESGGEEALFSLADEIHLRAYFACDLPPPPGERSNFGSMCARAALRNRRSQERPSPEAPWTEILECPGTSTTSALEAEEAFVAYIDARRRFRRVRAALAQLAFDEHAALEAYFAPEPLPDHPLGRLASVGPLTPTAQRRNRARAARGLHEPAGATIRWLAASTAREARTALDEIRREAAALFAGRRRSYARARILEDQR